ncbi:MAG: transglycosylase [Hyphomicrobiaceae bacterium]|nr:transglycosylase [Hyphomicrobiaceae bacterium]
MPYAAVSFDDIPGWLSDDVEPAFIAFMMSASTESRTALSPNNRNASVPSNIAQAARLQSSSARNFFETNFTPHRIAHEAPNGLLTGYFEPIIAGARFRSDRFPIPLHRRPSDLVNIVAESDRGATEALLTHGRRATTGIIEAYATRRDIDQGALNHQNLELLFVADVVDRFIIQVQGSAAIRLPDGTLTRVNYDGKNGHPYTSIGRVLINQGHISAEHMTLATLTQWLKADLDRAAPIIWHNESYVFFRELGVSEGNAPLGVLACPLTPGRSLAVDTRHHALGLPIFISAPTLTHVTNGAPFQRLMIAQDVGSAIKGPERGDIFIGTGPAAGEIAGAIKHPGTFYILLPNATLRP